MKKLFVSAAALVMVASAGFAQAPFADVPRDHWAYDAVSTLASRGLVIGYPDGMYGGKRAMTRYEFAVVIARMLPQLEDYVKTQIAGIPSSQNVDLGGYAKTTDLDKYATKDDLRAGLANIQKLVDEFGPELQALQVDVAGVKKDIASIKSRLTAVETEQARLRITGETNVIARMSSTDRKTLKKGVTPTDISGRRMNPFDNLLEASQVLNDTDLNIVARASKGITANLTLNVGNYLGGFVGSQTVGSQPPFDRGGFPVGITKGVGNSADVSAFKAYIAAPISLKPFGTLNIEAGKTGIQFTPYTLSFVDPDDYTNITKTDNGEVIFSGAKATAKLGPFQLLGYAGTHGTALLQGSTDILGYAPNGAGYPLLITGGSYTPSAPYSYKANGDPITTAPEAMYPDLPYLVAPITQSAGVHAKIGYAGFNLGMTYIAAGINNLDLRGIATEDLPVGINKAVDVARGQVYGANLSTKLAGFGIAAEYANSNLFGRNDTNFPFSSDERIFSKHAKHDAMDAKVSFDFRNIALVAGYKKVQPFFGAPGSWGQIGRWKNPTNVQGFNGTAAVSLTKGLAFYGGADAYTSIVAGKGANPLAGNKDAKIMRWNAGLKFDLTPANKFDVGVESVRTKPTQLSEGGVVKGDSTAEETFYNFGLAHSLSPNASLRFLYQIIDYRDKGANFLYGGEDARGAVAVGQFTVKF